MTFWLHLPTFLKALFRAPRTIGAIAPSGPKLARLITSEIKPGAGRILELGPGTGVFTRALLDRGVSRNDVTLVEIERQFVQVLRRRFRGVDIICSDACNLEVVNAERGPYAAIVSGLPLLNMPAEMIETILTGAFSILDHGGAFYQFTYSRVCSVPAEIMERLRLEAKPLGRVRFNVPPASVFRLSRREG